ncbi:hypothetical protein FF011L_34280 [Roseimaritima multifibrata]|uniref:DUF6884 domain-containing protein n=1 Tax=Roseimaritima multifibrata TaxID=1930274 RepID=A0A517MIF4_9BACT|nr:DUF6884 domain-containing protein [Roseimaritima multifibrata]QDS94648.1 hypothetical protein FF011L_34280 [Roseimaritima multifibrata]
MSSDKFHVNSILVVVPCGRAKIWAKQPTVGPIFAKDAYTGSPFKVNRKYAERKGNNWIILSAKYGFILPDFELPGPYEVTFKRNSSGPVSTEILKQQVAMMKLDQYADVIGLGGKEYRAAIVAAFESTRVEPTFPFAGLPIGKAMQATKQASEQSEDS